MAFKINYSDGQEVEIFLNDIIKGTAMAEVNYLHRASKITKENIKRNLKHFKTKTNNPEYKHMMNDVTSSITKDKYGKTVARIRGGKRTGPKWHLVNDGTYRTRATHFMDAAIMQTERDLEAIADEELKKGGL